MIYLRKISLIFLSVHLWSLHRTIINFISMQLPFQNPATQAFSFSGSHLGYSKYWATDSVPWCFKAYIQVSLVSFKVRNRKRLLNWGWINFLHFSSGLHFIIYHKDHIYQSGSHIFTDTVPVYQRLAVTVLVLIDLLE